MLVSDCPAMAMSFAGQVGMLDEMCFLLSSIEHPVSSDFLLTSIGFFAINQAIKVPPHYQ